MAGRKRRKSTPPAQLKHRWYLVEWAQQAVPPKKQADAIRDLDWPRSSASSLWNGEQRYNQEYIEQVSDWLNIKPYELLMHPEDAMAIRRLRAAAFTIAAETPPPDAPRPESPEAVKGPAPARRRAAGSQ